MWYTNGWPWKKNENKIEIFWKAQKRYPKPARNSKTGQQFGFGVGWVWRILGSGVPDPKLEPPNFWVGFGFQKFSGSLWVSELLGFLHTLPVLLNRDDKSIISALRSSSATWLEVLTNRGSPTQILILSVLELQSSCVLLVVDPIEPWLDPAEELWFQLGPFSSLTQIFSPLIRVIWLTTWSCKTRKRMGLLLKWYEFWRLCKSVRLYRTILTIKFTNQIFKEIILFWKCKMWKFS